MREHLATAEFDIPAPPVRVWELLTQRGPDPDIMFGAEVMSDWTPGSSIHWVGEWQGSPFDDYGEVVAIEPPHRLLITHTSTLSGSPAPPHFVEFRLEPLGADATHAVVTQSGNPDAAAAGHSAARWQTMLAGLARAAARSA